jgi:Gpi18-like mannosyltransferase
VDATVRQDAGGYTDDGWNETTHVTVTGARRADEWSAGTTTRDAAPKERGVAGWLAVLVLIGITGVGGLIDLLQGTTIKGGFNIALIVGSVVAILIVRRRSMFSVVVAPPLVYFVASAVVLYVRSGGLSNRSRLIDSAINWLVYGFPAIAGATAAVLIIAGVRMITHR